jgi:histidine triad (HIT) family protein
MSSVFTKIMRREILGHFVWEDELCVAIMTIQPVRDGHVLVIPRQEVDHWDVLPDELAAHLMTVAKKIATALKKSFSSRRVGLLIAGFEVPHTHLHVLPIDDMHDFDLSGLAFASADTLAGNAEKIRKAIV